MEREQLINHILDLEWDMFTNASSAGGRAACQDDKNTFTIMRKSQAAVWSTDTLAGYLYDLEAAAQNNINLMTIKYAHMMKITFPDEYEKIKDKLPPVSYEAQELAQEIMKYHSKWSRDAAKKYPALFSLGRPVTSSESRGNRWAAIDNYLYSELLTYSEATLKHCLYDTLKAEKEGKNLSIEILKNTARSYKFDSLEALEEVLSKKKNNS
ncbi:MAG: DUF4125 family protein [Spirochaetes bacterium]|nr:DUF4125 family protein [Spirochaetota bacterium]